MSDSGLSASASPTEPSRELIQIYRDDLIRLLTLCESLAKHYSVSATNDSMASLAEQHGIEAALGEAKYCCHYTNPISPGTQFCIPHTSYLPISMAKMWCIAQASGDSAYDHIQKGECRKDGGDKCDFIS